MTDWVTNMRVCNSSTVIGDLAEQAKKAVETRNKQIQNDRTVMPALEVHTAGADGFTVVCGYAPDGKEYDRFVRFGRTSPELVQVDGSGIEMFYVRVAMNDRGKCVLSVGDEAVDHAQLLQRTLSELLFPPETRR